LLAGDEIKIWGALLPGPPDPEPPELESPSPLYSFPSCSLHADKIKNKGIKNNLTHDFLVRETENLESINTSPIN
jgi:hypothetical protein